MTEFKGETRIVPQLHPCPLCGKKPVLRKDSTKRFQVYCECGCKTAWKPKTDAIIDWYALILSIQAEEAGA